MYSVRLLFEEKGEFSTFHEALQVFVPAIKEQMEQGVSKNAFENTNCIACSTTKENLPFVYPMDPYQVSNIGLELGFIADGELVTPPPAISEEEVVAAFVEEANKHSDHEMDALALGVLGGV